MSESLFSAIQTAMKEALRAKEQRRLNVLRLILAALKQQEIDQRTSGHSSSTPLDNQQVLVILDKMIKQRRDSIEQYKEAGRQELAEQEAFEIGIIEEFLPTPLTESEIDTLIAQAIKESNASAASDMGKVMAILKPQMQGRADMKEVSVKVKQKLG